MPVCIWNLNKCIVTNRYNVNISSVKKETNPLISVSGGIEAKMFMPKWLK